MSVYLEEWINIKKKNIFLALLIPIVLTAVFVSWNIKLAVNIQTISQLKNMQHLYESLPEYIISEDISKDISFPKIMHGEIEFQHSLGQGKLIPEREFFTMEFDEEKTIAILQKKKTDWESSLNELLDEEGKQMIIQCYGQETLESEYNLRKKAWEVTPDDISWFGFSKNKAIANMFLLMVKSDVPFNVGVFEFKTDNVKGFQYILSKDKGSILLQVFDTSERAENNYEIYMKGFFTKSEIEIILKTMKFSTRK